MTEKALIFTVVSLLIPFCIFASLALLIRGRECTHFQPHAKVDAKVDAKVESHGPRVAGGAILKPASSTRKCDR